MVKTSVTIYNNTEGMENGKLIAFERSCGFQHFLTLCSKKLMMGARRVYKEDGTEITDLFTVDNNDVLFISQGEEFMAKTRSISTASMDNDNRSSSSPMKTAFNYRVVIMGSAGVGKSAITFRYTKKKFVSDYIPTIEDEHKTRVEIDGKLREISILDTAGSEQFIALRSNWMEKREAFILVFSIDSPNSFLELNNFFDQLVMVHPQRKYPIILLANKIDLPEEKHKVAEVELKAKAEKWNVKYFMVSAKNDQNINEVFEYLVREIQNRRDAREAEIAKSRQKPKGTWDWCSLI